jgi:hypothetical protein
MQDAEEIYNDVGRHRHLALQSADNLDDQRTEIVDEFL